MKQYYLVAQKLLLPNIILNKSHSHCNTLYFFTCLWWNKTDHYKIRRPTDSSKIWISTAPYLHEITKYYPVRLCFKRATTSNLQFFAIPVTFFKCVGICDWNWKQCRWNTNSKYVKQSEGKTQFYNIKFQPLERWWYVCKSLPKRNCRVGMLWFIAIIFSVISSAKTILAFLAEKCGLSFH